MGVRTDSSSRRILGRDRTRGTAAARRGAVLVFFAFFFLALFGLFAVVVDLGIARVTQAQMQTSADVAALEGLGGRDAALGGTSSPGGTSLDLARRQRAALAAALVFDEDGDPDTGPSRYRLGAGLVLDTGVAGVSSPAGGVLVEQAPWVPDLQWNEASNLGHGDLVAGFYTAVDRTNPGRVDWHVETNDYARRDFVAADGGDAFLARLRRTRDELHPCGVGLEDQLAGGVTHLQAIAVLAHRRAARGAQDARGTRRALRSLGVRLLGPLSCCAQTRSSFRFGFRVVIENVSALSRSRSVRRAPSSCA